MSCRIGSAIAIVVAVLSTPGVLRAEQITYQVTGLFMPEREADLREAVAKMPAVKLVRIDYNKAEAVFDFDAKKFGKPQQALAAFDQMLKQASNHTFGVKPLSTTPADKLTLIEIPVSGCDCKACSLVAYEAVYKLDGVERATASFRAGKVTAVIDPTKTDRAKLEAALKKRGVHLK
ncbi:MAG TPA: heavy metal-associated domain-containing protein [Gemmataceae bacterium]|nr:heavy metal-associated domain-containing protein [Gemmataceae bacterium]